MLKVKTHPAPALIEAARNGEVGALTTLLAHAQPNIRRYARRQCRNASDAEDAVQETLVVLFRRIESLRAIESFSYWLFRIVDRACLRIARKILGIQSELDEIEESLELATIPEPTLRLDLVRAIESLPSHYRVIIVLRDLEERTIEEISDQLSLTRAAAKARLHRARTLVREYLTQ